MFHSNRLFFILLKIFPLLNSIRAFVIVFQNVLQANFLNNRNACCFAGMQNLSISCSLVCLIILGTAVLIGFFGLCRHQISAVLVTGVMYLLAGEFLQNSFQNVIIISPINRINFIHLKHYILSWNPVTAKISTYLKSRPQNKLF